MKKNGEQIAQGESSAVLGHPAEAIAMLVNILSEQEEILPAGSFVMSGGITEAFPVQPGDKITAEFEVLGNVSMSFVA
jgi:2-oxo-3-hexenedioate decarboxylase